MHTELAARLSKNESRLNPTRPSASTARSRSSPARRAGCGSPCRRRCG